MIIRFHLSRESMAESNEQLLKNTINELTQRIEKMETQINDNKSLICLRDDKRGCNTTLDISEINSLLISHTSVVFYNNSDINHKNCINHRDYRNSGKIINYQPLSYYLGNIQYFTDLICVIINDVGIIDLVFLKNNTKLRRIILEKLPMLEDIGTIGDLPNLKNITIINCPNIKNLKILEQCIGLKKLTVKPPINLNGVSLPSVEIIVI